MRRDKMKHILEDALTCILIIVLGFCLAAITYIAFGLAAMILMAL